MDDNAYWITLWAMVIAAILALATMIWSADLNNDRMDERLIKAGKSPIELVCSRDITSDSPSASCVTYVARMKPDGR